MTNDPSDFYLNQNEPNRGCLLALRSILLERGDLEETTKYGMPCFCFRKKALVYLWVDKKTKEPYLLFVDGQLMDHPMLEAGDRARMKIFRLDPYSDLPIDLIESFVQAALKLRYQG